MLKSTGYFRGIECPFREGCRRPHCHFRHQGRVFVSAGSGEARSGAEYEPYSPELPTVPPCLDDGDLGFVPEPSQDILELERVNKAIEEVKSEVEREQRRYEKLLGTQKDYNRPLKQSVQSGSFSPLEYDPGGSGTSGSCYNPTPLAQSVKPCKYTLDDLEDGESKSRFMEYVPTAVTSVSKYKTNKYVIDNSKPHTDMEYDPMSNYSARHLSKIKHQKVTKRSRTNSQNEDYALSSKKSCHQTSEMLVEAKFTDSEEDFELHCYSNANKILPSGTKRSVSLAEKSAKFGAAIKCKVKEIAVQYDMDDIGQHIKTYSKDNKKTLKHMEPKYEKKDLVKELLINIDSGKSKGFNKERKKEKSKSFVKKKSEIIDVKNRENKLGDHKKTKTESRPPEKNGNKKRNTETGKTLVANSNKKDSEVKGKDKICTNVKKDPRGKVGDVNHIKHKAKQVKSVSKKKSNELAQGTVKAKTKQRSLSHVDLFGDESSEEGENQKPSPQNNSSSSEKDEKSIQRSKVTSHRTSISSVDSSEIDYCILEKNLDSDSDPDPLEECLRVFNESQDVKSEDKGRMGKQLNEDSEEKAELNLTTLFAGQKRRISHAANTNHADSSSKPVIRPYCRPTPQEICYERIQRAQEQAAQLLAQQQALQLTRSVQKSTPNVSGEKKRIAHMPGSFSSSSCQSLLPEAKNTAPVGSAETCNGSSPTLKLRTLSGMTSKTTSSTLQKRQAHVPSLQSTTLKRPVIPNDFGAKVPTTVRQRYLQLFIDECLKFCHSQQEAFDKALEEEKMVYSRSSSRNIYLNVAVNSLKKLRSQGSDDKPISPKIVNKKAVSHKSVLGGKLAAKTSFSVQRNAHREEELTGNKLMLALCCHMQMCLFITAIGVCLLIYLESVEFSGVTEEDLHNTSITLRDVQAVLLCMFSCDTILVGHSLESDLYALKLIHPTVVDTAIVFPHRLGLPYKRALRSLMADHLKRIIQDSVEGHDSSEDACSCMELMIWRIKEDAKVKR
ncbi:RNA exonuclease 1 homolog [Mixophyes fleayi]|uniref:RNA exonuclease 1 homolog n=1 Tax=Mixophyes fleayi TaxID=3061075 RepID=UPI003F4E210B